MNTLYFGDNLGVLQDKSRIADGSVDLIYLDPPFNSKAAYNLLYKSPAGGDAQVRAFEDTWRWEDGAELALDDVRKLHLPTFNLLRALQSSLGRSDMMAYLAMMAPRLLAMHRVMRATGSLYLHCDPTASHYLKVLMDAIFGAENYRNEITWLRSRNPKGSQHSSKKFGPSTDTILYYTRTPAAPFYGDAIKAPLSPQELLEKYDRHDEQGPYLDGPILCSASMGPRPNLVYEYKGFTPPPYGWRMTLDKLKELDAAGNLAWSKSGAPRRRLRPDDDTGVPVGSFWGDIPPINSQAEERIGYPTQKPLALLERIILASSARGDTVLDPFCGCGTAIHAAERLGRNWIGIDVTYLAIQVIEDRLKYWLPGAVYRVDGIPSDEMSARKLGERDPYTFQQWSVGRLGGQSRGKGPDKGIDGEISFITGPGEYGRAIVSVKAGHHINPDMVRSLKAVVDREGAEMGVFVCMDEPTREVRSEAASGGRVELPGGNRPKIQIVTAKDLIDGPNLGILTQLNTVQSTQAARAQARKPAPKRPTAAELRNEPEFPPMPIKGGKARTQPPLPLDEPLLVSEPAKARVKRRS